MSTNFKSNPSSMENVLNQYGDILSANGNYEPISDVIIKDASLVGEHLGSKTKLVTVKFEDPGKAPLNLFMKCLFENESQSRMVQECKLFEKEASFFMEYLPEAREFCKSFGQEDLMAIYPKCYYADNKMIIFENLVLDRKFEMLKKEDAQDFAAAQCSLIALAKHHAISRAFTNKIGGSEQFFKKFSFLKFESYSCPSTREMVETAIENAIKRNIELIEKSEVPGSAKAISFLKGYEGKTFERVLNALKPSSDDINLHVLNHGDYWNNNMMFRMDDKTGSIIDHIMIDFQETRYVSLSADITYFMFTSVKPGVRRETLKELLKIYLNALKTASEALEFPIDFEFDELFKNYRKYPDFGFWIIFAFDNGLALHVLKDINPEEFDTMEEMNRKTDELIQNWLENNPNERKSVIANIIQLIQEYQDLTVY